MPQQPPRRLNLRTLVRVVALTALAVGITHGAWAVPIDLTATAETGDYAWNGDNIPTSATTTFYKVAGNIDLKNTAQHEAGHALGFTTGYKLFRDNVSLDGGGPNRQYKDKDDGTVLAKLDPVGSNHMRIGVTVDGNNQSNDIMRSDQVAGQVWGAQDTKVLQDAFNWQTLDIVLEIIFLGHWTDAQKATVTAAGATVEGAIGTGAPKHTFKWTVQSVPDTGATFCLSLMGFVAVVVASRKPR